MYTLTHRMIAKKMAIERSEAVDASLYTLYECRDESRTPWKKNPLGTFSRRLDPGERPFAVVASWVARGVVAQSRFVLDSSATPDEQQQQQPALLVAFAGEPLGRPIPAQPSAPALMQPVAMTSVACSAPGQSTALARGTSPTLQPSPVQPSSSTSTSTAPTGNSSSSPGATAQGDDTEADVRACLDFVNEQLSKRGTVVHDISELRSGVPLIHLLECLTDVKIAHYHEHPRCKEEELANWTIALKFLQLQGCTLQNSIPEDFFYGSVTTLLSLLAVIAKHFHDTPPIAKALRKSMLLRRYSRRLHPPASDPATAPTATTQQDQPAKPESTTSAEATPSTEAIAALVKKEKELADKEAFLTSWERSLQQREEDLLRRERLFQQQLQSAPGPLGTSPSGPRLLQVPTGASGPAGRTPVSTGVPGSTSANLFAMIQRRISRCERGLQRPVSMATQPRAELGMEPPPGLIRVQIIGEATDSLQTQSVSFRYQPEQTVRELLKQVCAKKMLKEEEWSLKFMNMDVTCSGDLTIGELGVIALRMCKKKPGDIVASDLGSFCDEFEPAVDVEHAAASAHAEEDDGLRRSTFNIEHIQESELPPL